MKTQEIPEWDGLTDYRPPTGLNYARDIVKDPCNSKWVERRKLTDAFEMGIEYAKRFKL